MKIRLLVLLSAFCLWPRCIGTAQAQTSGNPNDQIGPRAIPYVYTRPTTLSIAGSSVATLPSPTSFAGAAHVQFTFSGITGTYSGCTVQAQTTLDGTTWLNLGGAATLGTPLSNGLVQALDVLEQARAATGVTVTTPSSTAANGFGVQTKYAFSCGAYGTAATATYTAIYR